MRLTSLALLLMLAASAGSAQTSREPRRPKLDAGADTNDAHAYYDFAVKIMSDDAEKAADALYWATRIDPTWADPFYARRVALLLEDPTRFVRRGAVDQEALADAAAIDSLFYHALTIDPFVSTRIDSKFTDAFLDDFSRRAAGARGNAGAIRAEMEMREQRMPPATRAATAYDNGLLGVALSLYTTAIERDTTSATLRIDRAHVLFEMGRYDAALIDLQGALDLIGKSEQKKVIFVYRSKELLHHRIAVTQQKLGNIAAAKESYGRALQENLSYYPAHVQLALIALAAKDTATALSEFEIATQVYADDPVAQFSYGFVLLANGKASQGEVHLKKAMDLDPVYAEPRFVYARLLESADFREEALAEYKRFLSLAARQDPHRADAEARVAALGVPPSTSGYIRNR